MTGTARPRGRFIPSLAFYLAFYLGSIPFVLWACVTMRIAPAVFRETARRWSAFHRVLTRALLGIDVVVEGIPPGNGVLYAVRHESFFEAIDMPNLFAEPVVFAKQELMAIPLWGRAARAYGIISVDREGGARALRTMVTTARDAVAAGRPLVIFPEGTRVPHGTSPDLQSGFAGLYKLLALPVVPVAVDSGPLYHRRWKARGRLTYRFGEEIPPGLPRAEIEARVHAAINALNR